MDNQWAIAQLDKFIALAKVSGEYKTQQIWSLEDQLNGVLPKMDTRETAGDKDEIDAMLPIIAKIAEATGESESLLPPHNQSYFSYINAVRRFVIQLKSKIENQEEIEAKIGDISPKMSAASLHPWIWEAAKSRWNTKHYGDAVNEVGRRLKDELEVKADRHQGETEQTLFNHVFGSKSTACWDDIDVDSQQDQRRRAVRGLAEGFYAGIRNPLSHKSNINLEENEALQWMAIASRIAHWIETARMKNS